MPVLKQRAPRDPRNVWRVIDALGVSREVATRLWLLLASPRLVDMQMSVDNLALIRANATKGEG